MPLTLSPHERHAHGRTRTHARTHARAHAQELTPYTRSHTHTHTHTQLGKITLDKTFEERDALNQNIVRSIQ